MSRMGFHVEQISGFDRVEALLRQLPAKVARKEIVSGLRKGAKVIADDARSRAPVYAGKERPDRKPGQLRDSIKVRSARARSGSVGVNVITSEGWFIGDEFYGAFVEFGHGIGRRSAEIVQLQRATLKARKKKDEKAISKASEALSRADSRARVRPHPFMRPAFDARKNDAIAIINREIGQGIEKAARELGGGVT